MAEVKVTGRISGELSSVLAHDGDSAYEIAVRYGFEGTEEEWLASLKEPAETAAEEANASEVERKANESIRQEQEQERKTAEAERQQNEAARVNSETARSNAELIRTGAETERAATEANRAEAENIRAKAEENRVLAETLRANNESARASAEEAREQAEADRIQKVQNGYFDGDSAYQVAVKNGYKGTEQEWLKSLSGVYLGSGDMPNDCYVQIDPDGDALDLGYIEDEIDRLSEEKVDKYRPPINRLSIEGEQVGYALNKGTGGVYKTDGYRVSEFCDIGTDNPYGTVTIGGLTGLMRVCFYDSEKTFISVVEGSGNMAEPITMPNNAKYARVQSTSEFTDAFVNIGSDDKYHDPSERTEIIIPTKASELLNDELYFSAKVAGEIKARHVDFTIEGINLFDESQIVQGYFVWHHNGTIEANSNYHVSDYVDISANDGTLVVVGYSISTDAPNGSFHRCAFYDADKVYISGISNGSSVPGDLTTGVVSVPENAKYIRVSWTNSYPYHLIAYGDSTNIPYEPNGSKDANPESLYDGIVRNSKRIEEIKSGVLKWDGLTWVSYGDSITAQGNNGGGYQNIVDNMLGFDTSYRRGVGGQTYKVNTATFYANPDGSYAGRYGMDGLTEAPEGTTEHLGYFASWDRITTMIPDSIRESIDLVVLCGGTNDHGSVEDVETDGVISAGVPKWIAGSTVDAHWAASSYYTGGDYDISTFAGAIASTITKMRIWCPNAVVSLATPYPRWNTETKEQYTNSKGLDAREMCEIQIATAKYMGCPVVDANAMCGIGGVNFAETVSDGVHPNTKGVKMYGKALADGLNAISPKII